MKFASARTDWTRYVEINRPNCLILECLRQIEVQADLDPLILTRRSNSRRRGSTSAWPIITGQSCESLPNVIEEAAFSSSWIFPQEEGGLRFRPRSWQVNVGAELQ